VICSASSPCAFPIPSLPSVELVYDERPTAFPMDADIAISVTHGSAQIVALIDQIRLKPSAYVVTQLQFAIHKHLLELGCHLGLGFDQAVGFVRIQFEIE
jgi:hypothetical protein